MNTPILDFLEQQRVFEFKRALNADGLPGSAGVIERSGYRRSSDSGDVYRGVRCLLHGDDFTR